jgi:tetratricopeptide (TPR) repeat protein
MIYNTLRSLSIIILFFYGGFICKTSLDQSPEIEFKKSFYDSRTSKILTQIMLLNKKSAISQYYQFKMLSYYTNFNIPFVECAHCRKLNSTEKHEEHIHDPVKETSINIIRKFMLMNMNEFFDIKKFYKLFSLCLEFDPNNTFAKELGMNLAQNAEMINECINAFSSVYKTSPRWDFAFYNGWLYYYYLKDYKKARHWLKLSIQFNDASPSAYNLYNTSFYLEKKYDAAISTTRQQILNTNNPSLKRQLNRKLQWFESFSILAKKCSEYNHNFNKNVVSLNDLINAKLISKIPDDPVGEGFYWDEINKEPASKNNPFEWISKKTPLAVDKIKVGNFNEDHDHEN